MENGRRSRQSFMAAVDGWPNAQASPYARAKAYDEAPAPSTAAVRPLALSSDSAPRPAPVPSPLRPKRSPKAPKSVTYLARYRSRMGSPGSLMSPNSDAGALIGAAQRDESSDAARWRMRVEPRAVRPPAPELRRAPHAPHPRLLVRWSSWMRCCSRWPLPLRRA